MLLHCDDTWLLSFSILISGHITDTIPFAFKTIYAD